MIEPAQTCQAVDERGGVCGSPAALSGVRGGHWGRFVVCEACALEIDAEGSWVVASVRRLPIRVGAT